MKVLTLIASLAAPLAPAMLHAQEVVIGAGFADFGTGGLDGVIASAEYRPAPFASDGVLDLSWAFAGSITGTADAHVAAGVAGVWALNNGLFLDVSLMPGLYVPGVFENDLGNLFEFRTAIGAGYRFTERSALSFGISHVSNASTGWINPGMETYQLRYHHRF